MLVVSALSADWYYERKSEGEHGAFEWERGDYRLVYRFKDETLIVAFFIWSSRDTWKVWCSSFRFQLLSVSYVIVRYFLSVSSLCHCWFSRPWFFAKDPKRSLLLRARRARGDGQITDLEKSGLTIHCPSNPRSISSLVISAQPAAYHVACSSVLERDDWKIKRGQYSSGQTTMQFLIKGWSRAGFLHPLRREFKCIACFSQWEEDELVEHAKTHCMLSILSSLDNSRKKKQLLVF